MPRIAASAPSGSVNGLPILVAATASPGTTIHTATTVVTAGTYDEIEIWAYNSNNASLALTIQFGGITSPLNDIKTTLAPQAGLVLIVAGLRLNNGLIVRAYAAVANLVTIHCKVDSVIA